MVFADDYSIAKRVLFVSIGVFGTFMCSGIVFGFQGIRPSLIESGVYSEVCSIGEVLPCDAQILKLNLLFAIGSSVTNISFLPIGIFLDSNGPRITSLLSCFITIIGKLIFAMGTPSFDGFIVGYALIAFGGAGIYLSSMNLALAFPSNSGLIMALITGSFDASSLIYVIVDYLRFLFPSPRPHIRLFFIAYTLIPLIYGIMVAAIMPSSTFLKARTSNPILHDSDSERDSLISSETVTYGTSNEVEASSVTKNEKEEIEIEVLVFKQLTSSVFCGLAITIFVYMLFINTYISTIREQLVELAGGRETQEVENLLKFFNIALPVGG
ncbi:hypothetical protein HK096_001179, partial [Nowakowskiella sp. JEL0078]